MSYQTEVNLGGPITLPVAAGVVAVATTAAGRGVRWDAAAANLVLCAIDNRVDFILEEVDGPAATASCHPFTGQRNFRMRLAASVGTLLKGKAIKVDDSGAGLFDVGGAAGDINVATCEEVSVASGAALGRALVEQGTIVEVAAITDAVVAHDLNATFSDTEAEAALDALGVVINLIIVALETHNLIVT